LASSARFLSYFWKGSSLSGGSEAIFGLRRVFAP
jgi:hypothetical protein